MLDGHKQTIYTVFPLEEELRKGDLKDLVPAFNAYAASGKELYCYFKVVVILKKKL